MMEHLSRSLKITLALAVLALLAGGGWFYHAQRQFLRQQAEIELQAIAQLKVDQIVRWRAERFGDASVIMESPFFSRAVSRWIKDPQAGGADAIRARFSSLRRHYHYSDILLTDTEGKVLLRLGSRHPSLYKETKQALAVALRDRRPVLTDLHVAPGEDNPYLDVVTPLFAGNGDEAPIGSVILQCDAHEFFYPLIESWPTPSRTAETLLVRRDGDSALFLSNLRHQSGSAFRVRIPLSRRSSPAVMAVLGREGIVQGRDYRGVEVLAALKAVPDSPWFMVAKVNTGEALSVLRRESLLILLLLFCLTTAAVSAVLVLWQRKEKLHFQELYLSEAARKSVVESRAQEHEASMELLGLLNAPNELAELIRNVAAYFQKWTGCEAVGLRLQEGDDFPYFETLGFPPDFVRAAISPFSRDPDGRIARDSLGNPLLECICGNVIQEQFNPELPFFTAKGSFWSNSMTELLATTADADLQACVRNRCNREGYESMALILLRSGNETLGLLQLNDREKGRFDENILSFVEYAADQVAIAIAQRKAQDALRRSEHLNRSLVDHLPLNIFLKDRQSVYLLCNANYARDLGIEPAEIVGKDDFAFFPSELANAYRADDQTVMAIEKRKDIEERYMVHGQMRWVHTSKIPYYDEQGCVAGVIGIFEDITERKRLIDVLERSNRELEQFAHVTAHDLQEPLRRIISFTELLAERYRGRLDEKADSYIEFITSGSRQMSMRINALLTYSSMTMRAKELAPTDCGVVVQEALSDLSLKIKENGTVVTFDPLPTVMADDTQLGLVFLNLISNAIKFRGTEPPRIHISALSIRDFLHINTDLTPALLKHLRDMQRGWVFSVRDNGIGIEPQYHEKIFRIFQRLHTEKEYPGAGTGLAACRKVVEMHGGRIWVKSSAGEGATFFFSLPDTG